METSFGTVLKPFRIGLGAGNFGTNISERDSLAVLDTYAEMGGNLIDTAHVYGAWDEGGEGASEKLVGRWIAERGVRNSVILCTKGGHPPLERMHESRLKPGDLRRDLHESLERLQVDHIDMYWLHRDDPDVPVSEVVEAMVDLMTEGTIGCYGASNWSHHRIEAALQYAERRGHPPFCASQSGWALAERSPDAPPLPGMVYVSAESRQWHLRRNFPLVAYSAQANGFFGEANARWAEAGFEGPAPVAQDYDTPQSRWRLQKARWFARREGAAANQVALAYLLHQPFPVFPLISTSQPSRLRESLGAIAVRLSAEDVQALHRADA